MPSSLPKLDALIAKLRTIARELSPNPHYVSLLYAGTKLLKECRAASPNRKLANRIDHHMARVKRAGLDSAKVTVTFEPGVEG